MKFKEHDGLIFKMLEKPVQLKEKNTNVLVQFITHGVIGEYVMEHWLDCGQENAPIFVDSVDSDGDVIVFIENGNKYGCPFPMFEIIGYPVEEGSKDWALYQIGYGNKVAKEGYGERYGSSFYENRLFYLNGCGCLVTKNGIGLIDPCSEDEFLSLDETGWQIYKEPKPKPAKEQFEVDDWVEFIDVGGRKSQGKYLSNIYHNEILVLDITCNLRVVVPTTKIIRKLKPSEVEVDFGFAKGRILSRTSGDVKVLNNKSIVIATIIVSEITNPATRELVESLLEAMREEK